MGFGCCSYGGYGGYGYGGGFGRGFGQLSFNLSFHYCWCHYLVLIANLV